MSTGVLAAPGKVAGTHSKSVGPCIWIYITPDISKIDIRTRSKPVVNKKRTIMLKDAVKILAADTVDGIQEKTDTWIKDMQAAVNGYNDAIDAICKHFNIESVQVLDIRYPKSQIIAVIHYSWE